MKSLFEFLNTQTQDALILYALVFLAFTYMVMQGIISVARAISQNRGNRVITNKKPKS